MRTSAPVRVSRAASRAGYVERVNRAIDHILANVKAPLRLDVLAREARLSPFHFHRVFQAMVGQTPAEFVKRVRLDKALALLSHSPRMTMTQVGAACGFSSPSDFSRSFKQRFGAAPSAFDLKAWRASHKTELEAVLPESADRLRLQRRPTAGNPDGFRVRLRTLPARTVAYIRVSNPYEGMGVVRAAERLMAWAEVRGLAGGQWLGYQWENPEVVPLEDCAYYVAVEAERFVPSGEVGRFRFPEMTVAQIEIRGDIELELRALYWLYGSWLPASGYVPDDQPAFEAWIGRPFAHGMGHFELYVQLPVRVDTGRVARKHG